MKNLSALFALALLATTAVGVAESRKSEVALSDLAMANIEALAQSEDDYPEFWENCKGSWDAVKCVCGNRAFTYAEAVKSPCRTESMER